jgi:hypothetical protein
MPSPRLKPKALRRTEVTPAMELQVRMGNGPWGDPPLTDRERSRLLAELEAEDAGGELVQIAVQAALRKETYAREHRHPGFHDLALQKIRAAHAIRRALA